MFKPKGRVDRPCADAPRCAIRERLRQEHGRLLGPDPPQPCQRIAPRHGLRGHPRQRTRGQRAPQRRLPTRQHHPEHPLRVHHGRRAQRRVHPRAGARAGKERQDLARGLARGQPAHGDRGTDPCRRVGAGRAAGAADHLAHDELLAQGVHRREQGTGDLLPALLRAPDAVLRAQRGVHGDPEFPQDFRHHRRSAHPQQHRRPRHTGALRHGGH